MRTKYTLQSFDDILLDDLRDCEFSEFAAAYLQDAWDDSAEEFLVALRKYIHAHGGMAQCAQKAHITREALYWMLSATGNPELRSLRAVLQALGLGLSVTAPAEHQEPLVAA